MNEEHDERPRPRALAPLDEAYVAHADALSRLAADALRDVPLELRSRDREHGGFLRAALHLRHLADALVEKAVVVEKERGASWSDIGTAAEMTKQSAHEKWGTLVADWTVISQRRHPTTLGAAHIARSIDAWYAEMHPDEEHAVTAGLTSTKPMSKVAEARSAAAHRVAARLLYARLEELKKENTEAFNAAFAATGTDGHAAARRRWANTHTAQAEVYDQLAVAEPTIADKHRAGAEKQRELATSVPTPGPSRSTGKETGQ
ncbi:hypothetical protein ABZ208_36805 [Streptomyces sp. NPDC006208]|uniref:hypothetical protein n=1 Tax=Streptomyces sp. NPDC006208 TaxID=3156734 RepID=UPI0033B68189